MATAPELYEVLNSTLSWLTSHPGGGAMSAYDRARAVLTKATTLQGLEKYLRK